MIDSYLYSHFSTVRSHEAWYGNIEPSLTLPSLPPNPSFETFDPEKHAVLGLLFDLALPENATHPTKRLKGGNSVYDFTVNQRRLAKEAITAQNIQELEDSVSLLFQYLPLA